MTVARLSGRVAGAPGDPWLWLGSSGRALAVAGQGAWCRRALIRVQGGDDVGCPGPGGLDSELSPPSAASDPRGGVQDAVAQRLGLGPGKAAVEGEQLGARPAGSRRSARRKTMPCSSPSHATGTGRSRSPCRFGCRPRPGRARGGRRRCRQGWRASRAAVGQVGDPQGVPPAVLGLEQAQLGAGCGRSRRAKTRISARPAVQLVPAQGPRAAARSARSRAPPAPSTACAQHRSAQLSLARRSRISPC